MTTSDEPGILPVEGKIGLTWRNARPCPECGHPWVIGMLLTTAEGAHQHTWYVCTYWASGPLTGRCGWTGYFIPEEQEQ